MKYIAAACGTGLLIGGGLLALCVMFLPAPPETLAGQLIGGIVGIALGAIGLIAGMWMWAHLREW